MMWKQKCQYCSWYILVVTESINQKWQFEHLKTINKSSLIMVKNSLIFPPSVVIYYLSFKLLYGKPGAIKWLFFSPPQLLGWVMGNYWWHSAANGKNSPYFLIHCCWFWEYFFLLISGCDYISIQDSTRWNRRNHI